MSTCPEVIYVEPVEEITVTVIPLGEQGPPGPSVAASISPAPDNALVIAPDGGIYVPENRVATSDW